MKKIVYFLLVILLSGKLLSSNDSISISNQILDGILKKSDYSKPFISEFHSTINKVELGYNRYYAEYSLQSESGKAERPMIELHVGFESPLFNYTFKDDVGKDNFSIGATLPLSVHVLEDIFEPVTAAVINTDFRFGAPRLKAIKYLNEDNFIKNISISWIPIFHECTHLGDEVIIYRKDVDFPITRINVSYEYTEFHLTLNDIDKSNKNVHSFRLGGLYRISDRGYGYFDIQKQAIDVDTITYVKHSEHRFEWFAAYQFQRTEGFLASTRWRNLFSAEYRSRLRYGYPTYKLVDNAWVTSEVKENLLSNFNVYFGWKFYDKEEHQSLGLFLHYFKGVNPWGQMRNYPNYGFLGLSLTYEP